MRKIFVGLVILAVAALFAGPVSAYSRGDEQVTIGNMAGISNTVTSVSDTGLNQITDIAKGCFADNNGTNRITTGDATAMAGAINVANSNVMKGCCGDDQTVMFNRAGVGNTVLATSYTSGNGIVDIAKYGDSDGNNTINTGDAGSAAGAITVVNSNITRNGGI